MFSEVLMNATYRKISKLLNDSMNVAAGLTAYSSLPKKLPGYHLNKPDPQKKSPKTSVPPVKKTKDKYRV